MSNQAQGLSAVGRVSAARLKSKTLATWIAVVAGCLGAHRFYLHGHRDVWAWLHPWPTLLGAVGVLRMRTLGQDDHLAWVLIPMLGLMLSIAMLAAIVIGLTPDEAWANRFNSGQPARRSGWPAVIGVILALMLGGTTLMGTVAFSGQKYFEYQAETAVQARPG